jgi:type II secretory pathway component PulF
MSSATSTSEESGHKTVDILGLLAVLFSPRVSTKHLAQLCRRLSTLLGAGVDIRTVCQGEVERSQPAALRARIAEINTAVHRGDSMTEAVEATGDFFPSLFREMVRVGDETGHLSEVFGRLAEHYEEKLRLRRMFLSAIAWPMIQLAIALSVVGFLIWIMGVIGGMTGFTVDPLGLGLVGTRGLVAYLVFLGTIGVLIFIVIRAASRGLVWTRPIQRAVLRIPALGGPLRTIAVARLAWCLHLTMEAGVPLRRAMSLSIRSTRNARYTDHEKRIDQSISAGNSIYESLLDTGAFDHEFLDAVRVGEDAGRLVESMGHLSNQYHERASVALKTLTTFAGFGIWALVAILIILLIFRLFSFYLGALGGAGAL